MMIQCAICHKPWFSSGVNIGLVQRSLTINVRSINFITIDTSIIIFTLLNFVYLSSCVMALWMAIAGKFCSTSSCASAMHLCIDLTKIITCTMVTKFKQPQIKIRATNLTRDASSCWATPLNEYCVSSYWNAWSGFEQSEKNVRSVTRLVRQLKVADLTNCVTGRKRSVCVV